MAAPPTASARKGGPKPLVLAAGVVGAIGLVGGLVLAAVGGGRRPSKPTKPATTAKKGPVTSSAGKAQPKVNSPRPKQAATPSSAARAATGTAAAAASTVRVDPEPRGGRAARGTCLGRLHGWQNAHYLLCLRRVVSVQYGCPGSRVGHVPV